MQEKLITINNLYKKYKNSNYVFEDFSYKFNKTGFYVLFGESGCGKTTLLNILVGVIPYNKGTISINGIDYENQIQENNYISYITQEPCFINYLTLKENIELCSNNIEQINELLKVFSLEDKINNYPNQLSGGEKERLSILITLLKNKKIILLDEPTASLDYENKKIIFELLKKVSKNVLVICSTHDEDVFSYCDETINFNELGKYKNKFTTSKKLLNEISNYKVDDLYKYIKKERNLERNKKINILLELIFTISILITFFCFNINQKLSKTIQSTYKVNYLNVYCPVPNLSKECEKVFKDKNVLSVDFSYSLNIPVQRNDTMIDKTDFISQIITLPSNEKALPLKNIFMYGKYPQNENEVVLGNDLASNIDDPESLVGQNVTIKTLDGIHKLKVVGILKPLKDDYFKAMGDEVNKRYFVNGKFNQKYINDGIKGYNEEDTGKGVYHVFYNKTSNMIKTYNKYKNNSLYDKKIYIQPISNAYANMYHTFESFAAFLLPITIVAIFLSLVYYYESMKINIINTMYVFSVYQLYGYDIKAVKKNLEKKDIINISKEFIKSLLIALLLAIFLNIINDLFNIFNFRLFNYDFTGSIIMFVILIGLSKIFSNKTYKKIKTKSWYDLIKNSGDLLW